MCDITIIAPDATVENSDVSFQENIPSNELLVLEDYDFELQDPDGVVISNTIVPAMIADEILVGANGVCPTDFEYNLNVNGTFKQVVTIDTFSDINITLR